jgi:hypothetical protein
MREALLDLLQQFGICSVSWLSFVDRHSNLEEVTASTKRW